VVWCAGETFRRTLILVLDGEEVGGFSPTQLKNMRKSNWIMKPQGSGVKIKRISKTTT